MFFVQSPWIPRSHRFFGSKPYFRSFNDGNKRTAVSTTTFLQMNGVSLDIDDDELVNFAVRVASEKVSNQEIAAFLKDHAYLAEVDSE
ncbi:MAG: type II toxin-antitoxin system death-on-curing family toxin [Candidatus Obscuribacterales bacterium]|nr:type II toxin-antitoxin system death-on-curing family toxin [Candidatus Obscuribacterales bacterium]